MIAPIELALATWGRRDVATRSENLEAAQRLVDTGVFSIRHAILITGLKSQVVYENVEKTDRRGGQFNPEALPELHELWLQWGEAGTCDHLQVGSVWRMGCSPRMIQRLTGIPQSNIYRWGK